jgi:hypothetical protein
LKTLQVDHDSLICSLKTDELEKDINNIGRNIQALEQMIKNGGTRIKIDSKEKAKAENEYKINRGLSKRIRTTVFLSFNG